MPTVWSHTLHAECGLIRNVRWKFFIPYCRFLTKIIWPLHPKNGPIPKVHSFLKQCCARSSVDAIWWYFSWCWLERFGESTATKFSQLKILQTLFQKRKDMIIRLRSFEVVEVKPPIHLRLIFEISISKNLVRRMPIMFRMWAKGLNYDG